MTKVTLPALEVRNLAVMAENHLLSIREQMVQKAAVASMEKVCHHRFCGFTYYKHRLFPNIATALEHSPLVEFAREVGDETLQRILALKNAADFILKSEHVSHADRNLEISVEDLDLITPLPR